MQRSWDTSVISLGFLEAKIKREKRLREIYFGEDEGKHFDSLSEADQELYKLFRGLIKMGYFREVNKREIF